MPSEPGVSTVGAQQDLALPAHGLRHRQDHRVAASRAHQGQRDAGVAAGAFDDGAAGLEFTGLLGGVHDGNADAVLDAAGRVVELELGEHCGGGIAGQAVQLHQRGAADGFGNV
jgi:hypothetical protein